MYDNTNLNTFSEMAGSGGSNRHSRHLGEGYDENSPLWKVKTNEYQIETFLKAEGTLCQGWNAKMCCQGPRQKQRIMFTTGDETLSGMGRTV